MNRTLRIALIGGATFLVILLYGLGDTADPSAMTPGTPYASTPYADEAYTDHPERRGDPQAASRTSSGQAQHVTLVDHGLQMPRGTQVVPEGWTLTQDIATDPTSGQLQRYRLDIRGPGGELIRGLGIANYAQMLGTSLEQTWRAAAMRGLQNEVQQIALGDLQRSARLESLVQFRRVAQMAGPRGMEVRGLEAPIRGSVRGQPVEGVVYVIHVGSPQMPGAGTIQTSVVVSPPDRLAETLRLDEQMANSYQPNPQYEQRVQQISQRAMQQQQAESQQWMANSQAQHQQRMANNQARFNSHQQMMQGRYDAADQQMQSWQAQQRSSDEMHRRTINGINETVDLYDASSGQTYYGVQSGYDSYWTDPTGNVVGTQGYDNPDVMRYNQATDLDDVYRQGGTGWGGNDGPDGW